MQSIKTRRLIKIRKIQIREIWNNIRLRNRYRFVVFVSIWFCSRNRSIHYINLQIFFASIEIKILNKIFNKIFMLMILYSLFSFFFNFAFIFSRLSYLFEFFCFYHDQIDIWITINNSFCNIDRIMNRACIIVLID